MTVTLVNDDLFDYDVDVLVNPVNCVGVSGKGLAKIFKQKYPKTVAYYEHLCRLEEMQLGKVEFGHTLNSKQNYICFFPTKRHWKDKSELKWIEKGLMHLLERLTNTYTDVKTICIPALGCGCGELDFDLVRPLVFYHFHNLPDLQVYLFEPK